MLRCVEDGEPFQAYAEKIKCAGAKQAYRYLIGWGAESATYTCFPKKHGWMKSVRLYRGKAWNFSVVPYQQYLSFYFRKPCLSFEKYSRYEILRIFPQAEESSAGEYIVRVASVEDAIRIASYIES
ncbi:hypothetical protein SAMN05216296_2456 [Pseudomonas pohangensis]|uniref:Uncharacterized protein n=1 Tax=Pseudomonas pohangensis TaxID=364197 RepID=A0A1H2GPP9_9PSED|nr:hypothetical protein SAMN05216296_2456 [Pseudomonas pohangensis]